MQKTEDKEPILGQKVKLKANEFIIDAWCTYNPFAELDEGKQWYKSLGWLFINPLTNKLTWVQLMPDDIYE